MYIIFPRSPDYDNSTLFVQVTSHLKACCDGQAYSGISSAARAPLAASQRAAVVLSFCDREQLHLDKDLPRVLEGHYLCTT